MSCFITKAGVLYIKRSSFVSQLCIILNIYIYPAVVAFVCVLVEFDTLLLYYHQNAQLPLSRQNWIHANKTEFLVYFLPQVQAVPRMICINITGSKVDHSKGSKFIHE